MNKGLIYDWNRNTPPQQPPVVMLDDETLRLRLGRTGRREAEQYAWSRVTERVLELYGSVLARRSVAA